MTSIYDEWMAGLLYAIDADDDPAGPQEQVALFSYLSGTTTADEAAHVWTEATEPGNRSAGLDWSWCLLSDIAGEFPQDHGKLLELLDAMAQVLTTEKGTGRKFEESLVYQMYSAFKSKESASQSRFSTITKEHHYINLCAFIARLWHHQHGNWWTSWAMQLSHSGLEDDHPKALTNLFGQAVAQLFLFSGPEMYASSNAKESSEYSVGPLLLKERETATVSRWEFWKRRLSQLKESELLSNETGELFSKAQESVAKVETENGG